MDRLVAASTAARNARGAVARRSASSPASVVPPGLVTWSRSSAGDRPVAATIDGGADGGLRGELQRQLRRQPHRGAAVGQRFDHRVDERRAGAGQAGDRVELRLLDLVGLADAGEQSLDQRGVVVGRRRRRGCSNWRPGR